MSPRSFAVRKKFGALKETKIMCSADTFVYTVFESKFVFFANTEIIDRKYIYLFYIYFMYILLPKQYLTAQNNNYFLSFPQRIQRILVNS